MAKYRSKQVEIEAEQFNGTNLLKGMDFNDGGAFVVTIHEQICYVEKGDYIIPEPDGIHFYPCKPDIFEKKYERIQELETSSPATE